jgi:hypothetical protein
MENDEIKMTQTESMQLITFSPLIIGVVFCWVMAFVSPFTNMEYRGLLGAGL